MPNQVNSCLSCQTEMLSCDDDPNGNKNSTCVRCRAEESHDFDKFPNVFFTRQGEMLQTEELVVNSQKFIRFDPKNLTCDDFNLIACHKWVVNLSCFPIVRFLDDMKYRFLPNTTVTWLHYHLAHVKKVEYITPMHEALEAGKITLLDLAMFYIGMGYDIGGFDEMFGERMDQIINDLEVYQTRIRG